MICNANGCRISTFTSVPIKPAMRTSPTIMLVEDDQDDQHFFLNALEQIRGFDLFGIAENGKEAIEKLRASPILPTMIFMDVNMPLMNGIECLRKIMGDPVMNDIQVIMLSTDTHHENLAQAIGAVGFIKKPTTVSALHLELERMLLKLTKSSVSKMKHITRLG